MRKYLAPKHFRLSAAQIQPPARVADGGGIRSPLHTRHGYWSATFAVLGGNNRLILRHTLKHPNDAQEIIAG